jgi:hypothetical protein
MDKVDRVDLFILNPRPSVAKSFKFADQAFGNPLDKLPRRKVLFKSYEMLVQLCLFIITP